jgi:ubiquinone/menaquinone biosynthesis C-methylase UbiE
MKRPLSNVEWQAWGETDPLFGVASLAGKNRKGEHPWTDPEFYAHGAENWGQYRRHWELYGVNRKSCVEIGCGAGRITLQLANYFDYVHAIDVSEAMIEYARRNVDGNNVSFRLTEGASLPLSDNSVTAAFSCEVFQHFNRVRYAELYFVELYRVLDLGGSLMIHLPIYAWPTRIANLYPMLHGLWRGAYLLQASVRRPLIKLRLLPPFMYGVTYESRRLLSYLWDLGFRDIEIHIFGISSADIGPNFRPYLFARKPIS